MRFTQEISIFKPHAIEYAVTSLGTRITQTAAEIRLEAAQTLSNYSTTIQMNSVISQKADQITTEVSQTYATQSSQTAAVNSLSSRITQNANSITSEVTARGNADSALSSRIAQTLKSITFNITNNNTNTAATLSMSVTNEGGSTTQLTSKNINLTGLVTISSLAGNGTTTIDGSNIKTGTISANRIGANSISVSKLTGTISNGNWKIDLDNGTFSIGDISANNITTGTLTGRDISGGRIIQTVSGAGSGGIGGNGSNGQQASIQNGIVTCGELAIKGSSDTITIVPEGIDDRGHYGIYVDGHLSTTGPIWTNGGERDGDIICRGNAFAQNFIPSDRRVKKDIVPLDPAASVSFVMALNPVSFEYKNRSGIRHGFIAQDVQKIAPEGSRIVIESPEKIDGENALALNYMEIIADIVATIQSQDKRLEALERGNNG